MSEKITFGAWLRQQRRILDLTQQVLADQAGCARITLRRIEADVLKPSKELALILLEKVGVPEHERSQWVAFARGLTDLPIKQAVFFQTNPITNVPAQITTFIGREKEGLEIITLINKHRHVTLTGSGGIGKTRLSLKIGGQVLADYAHGVWLVELAPLSDPALLSQTVAKVFGLAVQSDIPLIELLVNFLRGKTILLILDNCEHLLDVCAHLADTLLKNCPNLKILATSREPMGITGEAIYRVPSLELPNVQLLLENFKDYESVRLFEERAQLAQTEFSLTLDNASFVAQICSRLDGIPLALELAAAKVSMFSTKQIADQLEESFNLLTGGSRTALPRQQTIRASINWSWGLLTESEQTFMRQLSVFAGGWTLESARAVCDGEVLGLTSSLVKKSLIVLDQTRPEFDRHLHLAQVQVREAGSERRYHFHEVMRQYAREKLVDAGEVEDIRNRHLKYFLEVSKQAETALRGPAQAEWLARLEDELDNIRTALEWADKNNAVEAGLFLFGRLGRFWYYDLQEGQRWADKFTRKAESNAYPRARIKALNTQGHILDGMEQSTLARSTGEECLALCRACGDQHGEVDALILLGFIGGKTDVELLQQALALSKTLGDVHRQADVLLALGWDHSDPRRARAYWEEAVTLFRQVEDWGSLIDGLNALGWYILLNGDIETAQKLFDETLTLNQRFKNRPPSEWSLISYGRIALMRGNFEQARAFLQEGISGAESSGSKQPYNWFRSYLGYVALREGNLTEARQIFSESAQGFQKNKNSIGVVFVLEGLAGVYIANGKPEQAAQLIGWADATRERIPNARPLLEQADVDRDIAAIVAEIGSSAFGVAYDAGRGITLDEAIALALE